MFPNWINVVSLGKKLDPYTVTRVYAFAALVVTDNPVNSGVKLGYPFFSRTQILGRLDLSYCIFLPFIILPFGILVVINPEEMN
jgi:hypothetical protein